MLHVSRARLACVVALVAAIAVPSLAAAQGADTYRNARRLGGSTSFIKPPLTTAATLKKMAERPKIAADIRTVLGEAGVGDIADRVIATMATPTEVVKGASCAEATPVDGTIVECDFPVGGTLQWMAFRPRVKGKPTPSLLRSIRWSGKTPFKAFLFRVSTDDRIYTFVVPKLCGNVSLAATQDIVKPPVEVAADRRCAPDGTLSASLRATGDLSKVGRVRVSLNGSPVGELTAPSWTLNTDKPGTYTFEALDKNGKPYPVARTSVMIEACPKPAPPPQVVAPTCNLSVTSTRVKGGYELAIDASRSVTGTSSVAPVITVETYDAAGTLIGQKLTLDATGIGKVLVPRKGGPFTVKASVATPRSVVEGNRRFEGTAACEATATIEDPAVAAAGPFMFLDVAPGKDRRIREAEAAGITPASTALEFGQCSPLLGVKFGVGKRYANNWEVAGSAGAAISLVTDDAKVNETALFVEGEVNRYMENGMFLGTGLALWDLTRSDTFTPAWMVHFGVPVAKGAKYPIYFIGEGRLYLDQLDEADSNYQFWGGIRVHFPMQ